MRRFTGSYCLRAQSELLSLTLHLATARGAIRRYGDADGDEALPPPPPQTRERRPSRFVHVRHQESRILSHNDEGDGVRSNSTNDDEQHQSYARSDPSSQEKKEEPKISVSDQRGNPISVQRISHFKDVIEDLPPWLISGLKTSGFGTPTAVQSVAVPLLMEARDVIGIAPTGSGKTIAFAVPALANIGDHPRGFTDAGMAEPEVLVLGPTRELVQQTTDVMMKLSRGAAKISAAFGGQDRDKQARFLSRGCDALVAAPGRLCDFLESGIVSLQRVRFVVFDEADRMLELGFANQMAFIAERLREAAPSDRVTMMWSATWHATVQELSRSFMGNAPLRIQVGGERGHVGGVNRDITQRVVMLENDTYRLDATTELFMRGGSIDPQSQQSIVFVKTQESCESVSRALAQRLRSAGLDDRTVQPLHGRMKQSRRSAVVGAFREGHIRVLVATDMAARGLDFPSVDHVINFEFPNDVEAYTHRIGRTGRAGRKGQSHTLVAEDGHSNFAAQLADYFEEHGIEEGIPEDFWRVAHATRGTRTRRHDRFLRPGQGLARGSDGAVNWRKSVTARAAPREGARSATLFREARPAGGNHRPRSVPRGAPH